MMSFDLLERTPEVTPLLVRLYDTHSIYTMAEKKADRDRCGELTDIMADLLQLPLKEKETELVADVLLSLMKKAEADLRVALSERLSAMNNIPLRIILSLANDEVRVAEHVLRQSSVLQDMDLLYILSAHGVGHGRAIAHRRGIGSAVIDALADTRDFEIAVNLSGNDGVSLTHHAYGIFTAMAEQAPALVKTMMTRSDLPRDVAEKMVAFVGEELKIAIRARFGDEAAGVVKTIDDLTHEMTAEDHPAQAPDTLTTLAWRQKEIGGLHVSNLVQSLRRDQRAWFLAQFSAYAAVSQERFRLIVANRGGYEFSMICRALKMSKADFISLYLLTERFRGQQRKLFAHAELSRIMGMYDAISPEEASRFLQSARSVS